jgi:hypothetical protein
MGSEPSDDELIAFAATLLGGRNERLADPELLRETVTEARELWVTLYQAHRREEPEQDA